MTSTASSVLLLLASIGLLVWIHELGHLLAAKTFRVRVDVLSLGFGPRIAQWRWGDTYWRLSVIALGGFTKLAGEHSYEALGDPEEYLSKPRWVRLIIASAGAGTNLLLAIILLTIAFYFGYQRTPYLDRPADIGWVEAGSAAAQADIRSGDRIIRLATLRNPTWADVQRIVGASGSLQLDVSILRDGREAGRRIAPSVSGSWRKRSIGWHPVLQAKIESVTPGLPAERAGLRPGDQIVSVGGETIFYWPRMASILGDKPVQMAFVRNGSLMNAGLRPVRASRALFSGTEWSIGVTFGSEMAITPRSLAGSFAASLAAAWNTSRLVVDFLRNLALREMSQVPLPIAGVPLFSDEPSNESVSGLLVLLSMVSLNLAIFNLLPIPILDGGVILMLMIEILARRDLSASVKEGLLKAGFIFLMVIVAIVIYRDISKIVPGH